MNTEEALTIASQLLEGWVWKIQIERPEPNRLDVLLSSPEELIPIVAGLRVQRLGYLSAITGLDHGPQEGELEVLYHFCTAAAVITLRMRVPRDGGAIPSLTEIIPSAESFERELREMFGVEVQGLRTPMALYLPDGWPAGIYPLRKDISAEELSLQITLGER